VIDRKPDGSPITKTDQVSKCGNSVCPPIACALVAANVPELAMRRAAA
jgi:DNA (cytosine-5)-methyltransferase 1